MSTFKERYEQRKKQKEEQGSSSSFRARYLARKVQNGELDVEKVGNDISERVNTWVRNNEQYVNDYNDRISQMQTDKSYRADAYDWASSMVERNSSFKTEADEIKRILDEYGPLFNEDYVSSITQALNDNLELQDKIVTGSVDYFNYWNSWKTEDNYNTYISHQNMLNDDLDTLKVELDDLQKNYDKAKKIFKELNFLEQTLRSGYTRAGYSKDGIEKAVSEDSRVIALRDQLEPYGDVETLAATLSSKREYYNQAKRVQKQYAEAIEENDYYFNYDISTAQSELDQLYKDLEVAKGFESAIGIGQPLDEPIYDTDGKKIYFEDYFSNYSGGYDLSTTEGREAALDSVHPREKIAALEKELSKARAYQSSKLDANEDFAKYAVSSEAAEKALRSENLDKYFTQYEKNRYFYLYNTEGEERATQYAKDILGDLEGRQIQAVHDFADDHKILGTLASFGTHVASMVEGAAKGFDYWVNGGLEELDDVYTARLTNAYRSGASEDFGELGQFLYNTFTSGLDSAIARHIPGGNVLLGISAMANGINDGLDRGLSDEQAFMNGVWTGIFEMFFEGVSFSNLNSVKNWMEGLDAKSWKSVVSRLAVTAGLNAGEETLTETANVIYDTIANGELSNYSLSVAEYMKDGMTEEQAMSAARKDILGQIGEAGASGFLMGLGMFAGEAGWHYGKNAVANSIYNNQQAEQYGQDIMSKGGMRSIAELEALAKEMYSDKSDADAKRGMKLADKVSKKASTKNVGKLATHMSDTVISQNKADITAALIEKGVDQETATRVAEYLGNKKLTAEQKAEIESNEAIKAVADQLLSDSTSDIATRQKKFLMAQLGIPPTTTAEDLSQRAKTSDMVKNATDTKNAAESEFNISESGTTITESEEIINEGANSLHLRDGGERLRSTDTEKQVLGMEKNARSNKIWATGEKVADSAAARLVNEGREVTVASLGVRNGSETHTVKLVEDGVETALMKKARKRAEERGLKVKFFVGDNLVAYDKNGVEFYARAYILGNQALVRADHPYYTADQLIRHELGHDMISKGEVDVNEVRERLKKTVGEKNVDAVATIYAAAYDGTGMTADEIWEECICDSLGDMNIFAGDKDITDFMEIMLPKLKAATKSEASNRTRGSPVGNTSREVDKLSKKEYNEVKASRETKHRKVSPMNEYATNAMQWAYSTKTIIGEQKLFYRNGRWILLEKSDDGFVEMGTYSDKQRQIIAEEIKKYNEGLYEQKSRERAEIKSVRENIMLFRTTDGSNSWNNFDGLRGSSGDERIGGLHRKSSDGDGSRGDESGKRDIGNYSRKLDLEADDYNNFGWVRDNNVIGAGYWKNFTENFAQAVSGNQHFPKNKNGEYMIDVYDVYDSSGVADVIVFTGGTIESPEVSKIIKINSSNSTTIEETRRDIYALERRGIQCKAGGILDIYLTTDFMRDGVGRVDGSKNARYNNRLNSKRRASEIKTDPIVEFHIDEDRGTITTTYANGETITENISEDHASRELDVIDYIDEQAEREGRSRQTSKPKPLSNRTLLAEALESAAEKGEERNLLRNYKTNLRLIESEQEKLDNVREEMNAIRYKKSLSYDGKDLSVAEFEKLSKAEAEARGKSADEVKFKLDRENGKYIAYVGDAVSGEILTAKKTFRSQKDTERLQNLGEEYTRTANRVNSYDKELLKLEAMKPIKDIIAREKARARKRAEKEGQERLDAYREKMMAAQEETITRYRATIKKGVEDRRKTELRHKIANFKKKLEGMLQHPTDRQYVPVGLARAMIEVCELINTDTDLYKKDGSINKAQERRNLTKEKLRDLKEEYDRLQNNADPLYSSEFDGAISEYLQGLVDNYGGKRLHDMTIDELREMYAKLCSIDETLRNARKLIGFDEAVEVHEATDAIIAEQEEIASRRKKDKSGATRKAAEALDNKSLSPMRNVEKMSGYNQDSYLFRLFKKLEEGVRRSKRFKMEAYKLFESLTTGKNAKKYEAAVYNDFGKEYRDADGRAFRISKMQMMQAILSFEREQVNNMNHIKNGGFTFADIKMLRKGDIKGALSGEYAHTVSVADGMAREFKEALQNDQWAQDYMEVARRFFNENAKNAINETMLKVKHRIVATDKSYIPFEMGKHFIQREISAEYNIQQTISAYGMLKDTDPGASQAIIITGLNNVIDRHIEQVSIVYGLAVEIRDFNKVWTARGYTQDGKTMVSWAIERTWGKESTEHIEQAVRDIQGPRLNNQSKIYAKVKSKVIGAKFLLNLSIVFKQIGSMFSASSMLRYRSPVKMLGNLVYTMARYKKISAEVDKYTATAWDRRRGLSDSELQHLFSEGKKSVLSRWFNRIPVLSKVSPSKWIQGMDSAVALSLWRYAKQDTAKATGLKGDALLEATARLYDDIIESTQSMTDVLHRPEIQKSGNIASEIFGTFKTDLYQTAGQLHVAAGRFMANRSKENAIALGRTVYAALSSAVWTQLMTALFNILRYRVDDYRDEEDKEITAKNFFERHGFGLFADIVGYVIPLAGSEAVEIIEQIKYGESYGNGVVGSLSLDAIDDAVTAFIDIAAETVDDDELSLPSIEGTEKLVASVLEIFGVPAYNVTRFIDAVKLHAEDIANGEFLSFEAGADRSYKNHANRIAEAVSEEELTVATELFEEAVEELAILGSTDGEIGEDEIKEARYSLKTTFGYKYKDGEIDVKTITQILSELFEMSDDEVYWKLREWDYAKANGTLEGYSKYGAFHEAVRTGKDLKAVIKEYTDHGVTKETLASQITSYYRPLYIEMSKSERASLKGYLLNAYAALGYNRAQKYSDIDAWLKQ